MIDYNFSRRTFPVNKQEEQHLTNIPKEDILFECTVLAGKILGVRCCDTTMGDSESGKDIFYRITPEQYAARTDKEIKDYDAFINYFCKNFGKKDDRCYFATEYEAFYNIIKAWSMWKEVLSDDEKKAYNW